MRPSARTGIDNRHKGGATAGAKDHRTYLQRRLEEGSYRPIGSEGLAIPVKVPTAPTYLQDYLTRRYPEIFNSESR
jgi:hypothetical protein